MGPGCKYVPLEGNLNELKFVDIKLSHLQNVPWILIADTADCTDTKRTANFIFVVLLRMSGFSKRLGQFIGRNVC